MIDEVRHEGYWFLPGSAKVPGTMVFAPTTGILLSLNGLLSETPGLQRVPVIFGETASGRLVTLNGCLVESFGISMPGYGVSGYRATSAFIGAHLPMGVETQFPAYRVQFWNLEEFIGLAPLDVQRGAQEISVSAKLPESKTAILQGFRLKTEHRIASGSKAAHRVELSHTASLLFECETPASALDFLGTILRPVHTIAELAADGALPLVKVVGVRPAEQASGPLDSGEIEEDDNDEVEMLFKDRTPFPPPERVAPHGLAFTIDSLGDQWQPTMQAWQGALVKFGPTFDHYFSLNRSSGMPVEHRFLSLSQALESLHRRAFPDMTREPADVYRARKKRLCEGVSAKPDRRWLAQATQWANEPPLRARFAALWELMPEAVQQKLGSQEDFSKQVADTRNYLTHFNESRKGAALVGVAASPLVAKLGVVLRMMFLLQLGLNPGTLLNTPWGERLLARMSPGRFRPLMASACWT